jgi:PAS domain S-box-containing protein
MTSLVSGSLPRRKRPVSPHALWLGLFPVLLALALTGAVITAGSDHETHPILIAFIYPVLTLSFVVSGLVARTLRPENGTGRLLVLVGFLWMINAFWESDRRIVFGLAELLGGLFLAAFVHLMLAFPEGKLGSRVERRLIAGLWLTALAASALPALFQRRATDCESCPDNPILIADRRGLADALGAASSIVGLLIFCGVVVLLVRRWRQATAAQRRILGPIYFSGCVTLVLVALLFALDVVTDTAGEVLGVVAFTAFGTVPLFFLAGLLRTRLTRAAARLLREFPEEPSIEEAQDGLRRVLGDPTLVYLAWLDDTGGYVDARGNPTELPWRTPARVVTRIDSESGRPLAALVHDAALLHQQAVLDEVVSAARLAIQKDRGLLALRRSEARSRALLDAIPDLMFTMARDGTYLEAKGNRSSLVRPGDELIGRNIREVLPPDVAEPFGEALAAPASRGVQTIEYRLLIEGEWRDFEARMVPSGDDEVVVIVRDFTDRTRLEEELARRLREVEHEQEFTRTIVDTAPIVLLLCDLEGRIVRFNHTAERLLGHADDEAVRGRTFWDVFVDEEDRDAVEAAFGAVHPVRPVEIESRWRARDGTELIIEASIAHIIDGQGVHRRIVAGHDLSGLVAKAKEARAQRDFLSVVAAATPSFLAVVESDGTVAAEGVNRAFAEAMGYDDETAPGRRFWDLVVPADLHDEFRSAFSAAVAGRDPVEHESTWQSAAGDQRLVEWSCRPLVRLGKYLISGVDVTERKRQSDEVRASRARLVEAGDAERRRLERNLHDGAQQRLVSLSLALRLAQARLRDDPDGAEKLLAGAGEELSHAIAELRELARGIHPAVLTDRGLGPALEALAARAPLPVQLSTRLAEPLPGPVEAAAYYVVAEALTNVAKYAGASAVEVRAERQNGRVLVEVSDDGIGGADPALGSGLRGLADRVAVLDGELEVESSAGIGTKVRAVIPLSAS